MSYPYPQQGSYPQQQQGSYPPPSRGQQPPPGQGGQWGGPPPGQGQGPGGQWGGPQPQQHPPPGQGGQWGGPPPGQGQGGPWGGPQQQQQQQQWGQPPASGAYPQQGYGHQQPSGGQPGGPPPHTQQPPGTYQPPPTQPPSGFQGWYTQYYHQMSPQEMQQVRQWFMNMDRDRSGSISANELANVAIGGIPLGFETAIRLIRVFDVDKNGTIDFYEYASLHKFLLSMQGLFQQQDRDRNGRLDANEIGAALNTGGFRLAPISIQALFRKYNKSGTGLTMVDFLALIAHVAQVKSIFEWRDKQKSGQLTLDMDALVEITSEF